MLDILRVSQLTGLKLMGYNASMINFSIPLNTPYRFIKTTTTFNYGAKGLTVIKVFGLERVHKTIPNPNRTWWQKLFGLKKTKHHSYERRVPIALVKANGV